VVVAMRKPWRIIAGFAGLGLATTAVIYVLSVIYDYTSHAKAIGVALGLASFILCPPTLFLVKCFDCEATGWTGVFLFSTFGLLNMALYAVIGAVVVSLRKKSN
jgi:hypothetical protein